AQRVRRLQPRSAQFRAALSEAYDPRLMSSVNGVSDISTGSNVGTQLVSCLWCTDFPRKRSRAEGDKRTEGGGRNPTRAMPCRKRPDGDEYGSESEVSGAAVSVPRGKAPSRSRETRTHFSRTHRQTAVGRYMNWRLRARLMLRPKTLQCRRTEARKR